MTINIYGIKNCDTMKKARLWLEGQGIEYRFHDYKIEGIDRERLNGWCDTAGWESVLNRAGTTFRKLEDARKNDMNREKAIELMLEQPSMIKRPVLEANGQVIIGFKPDLYSGFFGV